MKAVADLHQYIVTAPSAEEREKLKERLSQQPNTRVVHDLPLIDSVAIEIDSSVQSMRLMADLGRMAGSLRVTEDQEISVPDLQPSLPVLPLVDTQLQYLGIDRLRKQKILGQGVTVAVIDSGVAPHQDLGNRIVAFKDFVNGKTEAYDDHDHGTQVATTIAGSGWNSDYRWIGCAPKADIVGIKVLDKDLHGASSDAIAGIQWAVENKQRYNIRVINLSLGHAITESHRTDPVCRAVAAAVDAGIVVCVAAGNSGPNEGTILAPANLPEALAVGALNDRGLADPSRHDVAKFSSRGPTAIDHEAKPDLLAPGVGIIAGDKTGDYKGMSGTSAAVPVVSGIAALLLSVHPNLTPAQVKEQLMRTAHLLPNVDANAQGRGVVDAFKACTKN